MCARGCGKDWRPVFFLKGQAASAAAEARLSIFFSWLKVLADGSATTVVGFDGGLLGWFLSPLPPSPFPPGLPALSLVMAHRTRYRFWCADISLLA